jgi:hypothetical protein
MRSSYYVTLLLVMFLVVGCSQSGDFGAFIVSQVTKFGGHSKSTTIPKLDAEWTVKQDANGFQAFVTGASFADIAAKMEQIFGTPKMSDDGSGRATHEACRLWGSSDIGVAIQLIGHKDSTEIVCIRELKNMNELFNHKP